MKTFFMVLLLLAACTKKEEKPKMVLDMIETYNKAQAEFPDFDARLKKAGTDEGEQIKIQYQKELAKSRIDRMREQLKTLAPEAVGGAAAGGGGGGEGGGH